MYEDSWLEEAYEDRCASDTDNEEYDGPEDEEQLP